MPTNDYKLVIEGEPVYLDSPIVSEVPTLFNTQIKPYKNQIGVSSSGLLTEQVAKYVDQLTISRFSQLNPFTNSHNLTITNSDYVVMDETVLDESGTHLNAVELMTFIHFSCHKLTAMLL
ncbi:hypothetical protein [Haloplasma contractile]|uniref:Uncharacterized protein n=1 Tax=Haloplasma contractile SSD-17B TaxID=1033810 RepID=U2EAL2_9MOLU|nr:hypothetical protein [Haloplasma contractile]ERJ11861.1 hypothetical protein HLPCO_002101 [Haloplasma contractile SSD-17B]